MNPSSQKVMVVKSSRRDWIIGIVSAVLLIGFIVFGILSMSRKVAGYSITGIIVTKTFTPQPEEQVTIGKGGVHGRKLDGTYTFEVRVETENNRIYTVWVDKTVYEAFKEGDSYTFMRPPPPPR